MEKCCHKIEASSKENTCEAVAPVYLAYEAQLRGFVLKRVRDKDEANEILQQLYLKLYKNCEQLPEVRNVKAWLYQITRNAVYDYFRETGRSQHELSDIDLPQPDEQPEQHRHEAEALIVPLINLLPATYAEALRLSELEGLSQLEIASRLGISYSGAKSRVQRGREKLKQLFQECCHLEISRQGQLLSAEVKASCTPLAGLRKGQ
ncbi:RNA polymerase sigma factor SigZ [Pontibacter oryzae]|uniref:RNA polymerase sigma factor SigZ n=1 Tax=Pontibacter oryzae TaxID=2304593 RepID=A0A399SJB2_9BACT|nr:RNA polymerase sigma factor SigZ [Pontibacter oryzae]RIJ42999.1 RNA polymerase sigma factor SigZ [Pontibacter oryzae]